MGAREWLFGDGKGKEEIDGSETYKTHQPVEEAKTREESMLTSSDNEILVIEKWHEATKAIEDRDSSDFIQGTKIKIEEDTLIAVYEKRVLRATDDLLSCMIILIHVAFKNLPELRVVIISLYSTKVFNGEAPHGSCYRSIRALREIAEHIMVPDNFNLTCTEILKNFNTRFGATVTLNTGEEVVTIASVVPPFEEEGDRGEREIEKSSRGIMVREREKRWRERERDREEREEREKKEKREREEKEEREKEEFNKNMSEKECKIHQSSEKVTNCDKCGKFLCIECDIIKDVDTKDGEAYFYCEDCLIKIQEEIEQVLSQEGETRETYPKLTDAENIHCTIEGTGGKIVRIVIWGITPEDEFIVGKAYLRYPPLVKLRPNCKTGSDDEYLILKEWWELFFPIKWHKEKTLFSAESFLTYNNNMKLSVKEDLLIATLEYQPLIKDIQVGNTTFFLEMIDVDRQVELIYLILKTLPYIQEIILSFYCQVVDHRGHLQRVCYYSCKVLREVAEDINRELIELSTVIANFKNRFGLSDKGKLLEVQPFENKSIDLFVQEPGSQEIEEVLLAPEEFETKIQTLFEKMGFRTELTKRTGDGGIDLVAHNMNPIIKGKYIIQCKYYQEGNNVGEPAVRDLFGVVHAERAVKGIIVTTSNFTNSAKSFAEGKPLELIDGLTLGKLLNQYVYESKEEKGKEKKRFRE